MQGDDVQTWRQLAAVAVGVVVGGVCVVVAIFLHRQGVDRAGAWASIIGLLGIPIGMLGVWLAWPHSSGTVDQSNSPPTVRIQHNSASEGGTTFAVQDGLQIIDYDRSPDQTNRVSQEKNKDDQG